MNIHAQDDSRTNSMVWLSDSGVQFLQAGETET